LTHDPGINGTLYPLMFTEEGANVPAGIQSGGACQPGLSERASRRTGVWIGHSSPLRPCSWQDSAPANSAWTQTDYWSAPTARARFPLRTSPSRWLMNWRRRDTPAGGLRSATDFDWGLSLESSAVPTASPIGGPSPQGFRGMRSNPTSAGPGGSPPLLLPCYSAAVSLVVTCAQCDAQVLEADLLGDEEKCALRDHLLASHPNTLQPETRNMLLRHFVVTTTLRRQRSGVQTTRPADARSRP